MPTLGKGGQRYCSINAAQNLRCRLKLIELEPPLLDEELANVPLIVPTLIVVPEPIFGRPEVIVSVPSPLLSVVNVPTLVPAIKTGNDVLAAAPVTLIVSELEPDR